MPQNKLLTTTGIILYRFHMANATPNLIKLKVPSFTVTIWPRNSFTVLNFQSDLNEIYNLIFILSSIV